MLKPWDKVGIVACSNGLSLSRKNQVEELLDILKQMKLRPVVSGYLYQKESDYSASAKERAGVLDDFYKDDSIQAIFDISGGDLANGVLEYMDFDSLKRNPKPFWGYSDLTAVINAVYQKTGRESFLYQIRNLIGKDGLHQRKRFQEAIFGGISPLFKVECRMLRGHSMKGAVIGGNLRCFLKLAGTPYMPGFENCILFLESFSCNEAQSETYICQLKQMGAFARASGVLLGCFSKLEKEGKASWLEELILDMTQEDGLPVAKTEDIGHQDSSKCLIIGKEYMFS